MMCIPFRSGGTDGPGSNQARLFSDSARRKLARRSVTGHVPNRHVPTTPSRAVGTKKGSGPGANLGAVVGPNRGPGFDLERSPDLRLVAVEGVHVAHHLLLRRVGGVGCRAALDLEGELVPGAALGSLGETDETGGPAEPANVGILFGDWPFDLERDVAYEVHT